MGGNTGNKRLRKTFMLGKINAKNVGMSERALYEGCDFGERFELLRSMFEPLKIPFHTFDPSLKHYKPLRPIDELGMTCAH